MHVFRFTSRLSLAAAALCTLASAQFPGAAPVPEEFKKGFDSITQKEAKSWLTFLATKCEGRGSGQPGFQKAADFIAARFKEFGLKPVGDNGTYFQNVPFVRTRFDEGRSYYIVGGKKLPARDRLSLSGLGDGLDLSGNVVFIRAKGSQAKIAEADLPKLKGAIVVLSGDGIGFRFRGQMRGENSPALVLSVTDRIEAPEWQARPGSGNRGRGRGPSGSISLKAAKELAAAAGLRPAALDASTLADNDSEVAGSTLRMQLVGHENTESINVPNVVGLLEGSDPTLKAEVIGIGGHLDHLGKRGETVWPGADDDGSGSTAVLCVAKAISENPVKPKRSILFMTFCGEEMGLIGSGWYAEHPIYPHAKMYCELQMDMVGRDSDGPQNGDEKRMDKASENTDTMRLVGSKRISQELDDVIQEQNKYVGFKFKYDAEDVYTRSDHYNFAKNGIPIAFLFDGFTADYHQPTDTVDKIDWLKLTNAAKLYYLTAMTAAGMDHPLARNGSDKAGKPPVAR